MKRRLFAFLVVLLLLVSFSAPAFAAEERGSTVIGASISIYADNEHAFLVFTNLSNMTLYIGSETVSPNETITLGAFAGSGVRINYEKNNIHKYYTSVAVTYDILLEDVLSAESIINSRIGSYGTYHYQTNNCVHFAMSVWNALVPYDGRLYFSFDWDPSLEDADADDDGKLDDEELELYNYQEFCSRMSAKTAYYDPNPSFNL